MTVGHLYSESNCSRIYTASVRYHLAAAFPKALYGNLGTSLLKWEVSGYRSGHTITSLNDVTARMHDTTQYIISLSEKSQLMHDDIGYISYWHYHLAILIDWSIYWSSSFFSRVCGPFVVWSSFQNFRALQSVNSVTNMLLEVTWTIWLSDRVFSSSSLHRAIYQNVVPQSHNTILIGPIFLQCFDTVGWVILIRIIRFPIWPIMCLVGR